MYFDHIRGSAKPRMVKFWFFLALVSVVQVGEPLAAQWRPAGELMPPPYAPGFRPVQPMMPAWMGVSMPYPNQPGLGAPMMQPSPMDSMPAPYPNTGFQQPVWMPRPMAVPYESFGPTYYAQSPQPQWQSVVPAYARQYQWRPAPSMWMPAPRVVPPVYDQRMVDERDQGRFRPLRPPMQQGPLPTFMDPGLPPPMAMQPYAIHPFQEMRNFNSPIAYGVRPSSPGPWPQPFPSEWQQPIAPIARNPYGELALPNFYAQRYPQMGWPMPFSYPYPAPYGYPPYPPRFEQAGVQDMRYAQAAAMPEYRMRNRTNWWMDDDRADWQACNWCGQE